MINSHKVMDPPIRIDVSPEAQASGGAAEAAASQSHADTEFAPVHFPSVDGAGATAGHEPIDVERTLEQSRVRGHAAGYAAGLRAATAIAEERLAVLEDAHRAQAAQIEARLEAAHSALTRAAEAVGRATLPILEESDAQLSAAALELAEAVIGRELSSGVDGATAALERALGSLSADDARLGVTLRMHPDDLAVLADAGQLPEGFTVQADASLQSGDCIAELQSGIVDARIATALSRAKRALVGATE